MVMWLSLSEKLYNGVKEKQMVGVGVAISAQKFYATTSTAPEAANDIFRAEIQEKSTMKVIRDEPRTVLEGMEKAPGVSHHHPSGEPPTPPAMSPEPDRKPLYQDTEPISKPITKHDADAKMPGVVHRFAA